MDNNQMDFASMAIIIIDVIEYLRDYYNNLDEKMICISKTIILNNPDNSFDYRTIVHYINDSKLIKILSDAFIIEYCDSLYRISRTLFPYDNDKSIIRFTVEITMETEF